MNMKRLLFIAVLVAPLLASAPTASAQFGAPTEVISQGTSYRIFTRPGEATIRVQVLGEVGSGIYVIGSSTTLSELLALAGGPQLGEGNLNVRRTVIVRVLREAGGSRQVIYETDVDTMLREPGTHPELQDNDLVTVQSHLRQHYGFRETLQLVSSVGTLVLLALRLSQYR
jgi:hypothetical protein